jgi:hypothetical protein
MAFDRDTLENIHAATGGVCHRCGLPLELSHHGRRDAPDGWEIDVTRPQPKSTVLLPACAACLRPSAAAPPPRRAREAGDLSLETAPTWPRRIGYARPRDTPGQT